MNRTGIFDHVYGGENRQLNLVEESDLLATRVFAKDFPVARYGLIVTFLLVKANRGNSNNYHVRLGA